MNYSQQHAASIADPESYWAQQMQRIKWFEPPGTTLRKTEYGNYQWFPDGSLNTCYLALDQHVSNGRGEQVALYYDSPVTNSRSAFTYADLLERASHCAGALQRLGVGKGDRVIIYMPMVPEAIIAMLACARIGAPHSVVFGGFAARELALRVDDAEPKAVITASCGIELSGTIAYKPLVDTALAMAKHEVRHCIVLQRPMLTATLCEARDMDWDEFIHEAPCADPVPVSGEHPLYILYTSGTTGRPKGIVRDNGSHAVALSYALENVYGMSPGDVWWGASDIGWVVGHSFIVYAPLMGGCSTVLFEGKPVGTPDAGTYWRVIEEYGVNGMFCAPTAFRAIRKEDSEGDLARSRDLSSLKSLFVAGEKLDSATYHWLDGLLDVPVYDHWWQTETGWPMTAPMTGWHDPAEPRVGSAGQPVPGYDLCVLDEAGQPVAAGENGNICIRLPMPPGVAWGIWNNNARFVEAYLSTYPGYYHTGDGGHVDDDGFVFITGRTDDVINVAGHRLSTGDLEEVVSQHPAVAECCVVAVPDELKGQLPVGLLVLSDITATTGAEIEAELVQLVRQQLGAVACFRRAIVVERLPKTRSGKILRAVLRKIAAGEEYNTPSTIDDEAILPEITRTLAEAGYS
jgi:propionyl-CoA synthetase